LEKSDLPLPAAPTPDQIASRPAQTVAR
jgi:hypothetical protein